MAGNFDVEVIYGSGREFVPRLRLLSHSTDDIVKDALKDLARAAEHALQRHIPERTGHMKSTVRAGNIHAPTGPPQDFGTFPIGRRFGAGGRGYEIEVRVGARYANYVQRGTGIYGPTHSKIFAQPGNVFRFEKKGEGPRYVKWIEGQKAQDFLGQAAADLQPLLELEAEEMMAEVSAFLNT